MVIRGVVLVLALIAAGAFVLARGLDDNGDSTPAATEPTTAPEETPDPVDSPSNGGDEAATPAPTPDEAQSTTPAPEVTQAPAPDPEEKLECRDPSTIGVLVANTTDISGAAGRLSGELNAANYVTLQPENANPQTGSAFYFRAGYEVDARCIANLLGVGAGPFFPMSDPPPAGISLETLGNAYVLILIGPDSLAQRPG
ncbi:LytR C-terminal domain-containing protein [Candidatus Poriferisocius sp.]|uniref:LytR C-terminal domain-containing protein n=1 Tax=Candidatus Poriferisocius sp. TaxID=3101276 RepID=UPI003B516042